jgi:protocatechuate 3,4-dioxygenase beta subunit
VIKGRVLSTSCKPMKKARVDFWQADGDGDYDNSGYRLRGYQLTDARGRYRVATVVPGLYEGRTRHIHVKVTPPGGKTLTTQLYFPGEAANRTDSIFTRETLQRLRRGPGTWRASFAFAVARG